MTKLYTLTDINASLLSRHLTAAEAGRERADISEGTYAVVLGNYTHSDRIADDEVRNSPETSEGTEIWTLCERDRDGVWRGSPCNGIGRSADTAWEKFAFVPGSGHGNQGWRNLRGDVVADEQYDTMIDEMIAQDDREALKWHAEDERVAAYLEGLEG